MKGIILAGGSGTRLHPITKVISKQLLPIYDKPMIYYPLCTLMQAGIREILIITTPQDKALFQSLLGNGQNIGIQIQYEVQLSPDGLAQAFIIGEKFLNSESSCLVLGDNLFYGHGLNEILSESAKLKEGAIIFGYPVHDPERYGVVEFDKNGKAVDIEEKPKSPKSKYAVPGIYFFDKNASEYAKQLKPSPRGELEITDLNRKYLENKQLSVQRLGNGIAWLDTGTQDSLLQASQFIEVIEKRQGIKIGCPEEIAYRMGYITKNELISLSEKLIKSTYGQYLLKVANED